jgi:hypothetical protein
MEGEVSRLLADAGFTLEQVVADLRSIPRTIVARKPQ